MNILRLKKLVNGEVNYFESKFQRPVLFSLPLNIDVVLTKQCNLSCIFCKNYETPGQKQISVGDFRKLASQILPAANEVRFCSGGEPYLHKQLLDILRISKNYQVDVTLLSNGMLLTEDKIRNIIHEGLVVVHGFSVDGISPATVEKLRLHSNLRTVIDNIRMLKHIRDEAGKSDPKIHIRYALMRSNIEELPEAVHFWGQLGIDSVDCNYLSVCNDIEKSESLFFHQELMEQVFQDTIKVAKSFPQMKLNLPPTMRQDLPFINTPKFCREPFRFVYIDTDGRVLPCYLSFGVLAMGNVYDDKKTSFRTIWNSRSYRKLRRSVNNDHIPNFFPYCSKCENRFGWARIESHLGDDTWLQHVTSSDSQKEKIIQHRKRN